jgi:hypothetical protein
MLLATTPKRKGAGMSVVSHIEVLDEKCSKLDASILFEASRPLPDFIKITDMKKRKLLFKQEKTKLIEQLRKQDRASAS